jgi:hypothetical protein
MRPHAGLNLSMSLGRVVHKEHNSEGYERGGKPDANLISHLFLLSYWSGVFMTKIVEV